jgi:hypothetical protein
MSIPVGQILDLVGKLDDSPGDDTPRERFRRFLKDNILEVGQIRDYVEGCLRNSGDQYNRALQDLVNYIGHFLGFDIAFGRYQGVSGQIGFDGHWESPEGFHIVVEVKTSEVYAIKPATLTNYVNDLISEKSIPSWDDALGLYVVGRPDPEIRQLENSIIAEKRTNQLRIISVDSLLSLAEMMDEYDIAHEDILAVVRPSTPTIDPVIDLMARLVAEPKGAVETEEIRPLPEVTAEGEATYWLTSVKSTKEETAEECIQKLVGRERIYAFGERTPGRKHLKPGDWMCFYESGKGVVAHARVTSSPERHPHPKVRQSQKYPWVFRLDKARLYLSDPTVIDTELRSHLEAFRGRDPDGPWAWFVQATRKISERDFRILTRQQDKNE